MNATLQSLIHIPELSLYFLNEYPKDEQLLNNINSHSVTKGQLSKAYYEVVKGIEILSKQNNKNNYYKPKKFKKILGQYNNQFSKYEANDSKDLILYLLQTFHDELNYNAKNKAPKSIPQPDPTLRLNVYNHFICFYNSTNLSKISTLFYGTYENIIICSKCFTQYFSYQKFEYISFSTYNYRKNKFSIINGFEDMESKQILKGINQYHCKRCNKFVDAEIYNKIIDLPKYLILNIDYGKDKINKVNELIFEHEIDLKKYLSIYFGQNSRYRLISICTHIGKSGSTGHYITYCLNKENNIWYKFNDSSCGICDKYELKKDSPYLLLYEMIM
jgi:ubiquitin C-terminal hydrolase